MACMVPFLPRPTAVLALTRSAIGQAVDSTAMLAALPARGFAVLNEIEALVRRINVVVDRVEVALDRTERIVGEAEQAIGEVRLLTERIDVPIMEATKVVAAATVVLTEVERVSAAAGSVVAKAERVASSADELLTAYAGTLRKGAPMVSRFVEQLTPEEVDAAIRLVDELPKLTGHLTADVLPILATLDRVGPDIHDLLNVTRDLKLAIAGIPGLAMLRRRGEGRSSDER